jgi:hypothetical protein
MQVEIATIKMRLRILPTPRYVRSRKKVRAIVATIPRLLFAKINEKVKRRQKNIKTKRKGTAARESGSTK